VLAFVLGLVDRQNPSILSWMGIKNGKKGLLKGLNMVEILKKTIPLFSQDPLT
jgi:hypothetical protein